jgi:hypothetical protein
VAPRSTASWMIVEKGSLPAHISIRQIRRFERLI